MSKRTALIAAGGALGGAVLVGVVVLVISLFGDDEEESNVTVEQLELAAKTAEHSSELAEVAESIANDERISKRIGDLQGDTTEALGMIAALDRNEAVAARQLERANEANLDVATDLESIEQEVGEGRSALDEDQEASEEASERLASLSTGVEGLGAQVDGAKRRASNGVSELEQAIAALSTELEGSNELSEEDRSRLETVEQNLQGLDNRLRKAFGSLGSATESLGGELSSRSEELEPDVILDCPDDPPNYEISVRNMSCSEATSLISQVSGTLQPSFTAGEFSCSILGEYGGPEPDVIYGASDVRCESGNRAFRFDFSE